MARDPSFWIEFEMAEMALKEFHHGVRKRDISVCVRVGLRYKMRAFTYFLLSVKLPSSSCQVQVGHGSDSKLYYWMIYLRLSRWPLVWPIGSWRAGSGTTLSPSSRWNYIYYIIILYLSRLDFERESGFFLLGIYFPLTLVVVCSWVGHGIQNLLFLTFKTGSQ